MYERIEMEEMRTTGKNPFIKYVFGYYLLKKIE